MRQTIVNNFLLIVLLLAVVFAFTMRATIFQKPTDTAAKPTDKPSAEFSAYWLSGKAELNHYRLQQAHDSTLHPGEALLIFVTEDFRTDTQVKAEAQSDRTVPVLRANISRKFITGVHDYSLATSVFTPFESSLFPNTLKVSTSEQGWDGHSYIQLNYQNNSYRVVGRSYVEKAVDEDYTVEKVSLEDELWNRIRLNPDKLPQGDVRLIPGTASARLRHKTLEPLRATTKLSDYEGVLFPGKELKQYVVQYPTDDRTLMIVFERAFPHRIVGWEETCPAEGVLLTSRAVLTKTIQSDYWNHNHPADSTLRAGLMN